jgi:hypothetical protein
MSDSTSLPATLSVESADAPAADAARKRGIERSLGIFVPILTVLALLILWQLLVVTPAFRNIFCQAPSPSPRRSFPTGASFGRLCG